MVRVRVRVSNGSLEINDFISISKAYVFIAFF